MGISAEDFPREHRGATLLDARETHDGFAARYRLPDGETFPVRIPRDLAPCFTRGDMLCTLDAFLDAAGEP